MQAWSGAFGGVGNIADDPLFVGGPSGSWSANAAYDNGTAQTTFPDATASWGVDSLAGKFLNPDTSQYLQSLIVSNTETTVTVWRDFASLGTAGATYQINDYRLSPGSPCIGAADNTAVPADVLDLDEDGDTVEPLPFDLDNTARFTDHLNAADTGVGTPPIVDMGAYEFGGDCNGNGIVDEQDIANGTSDDCDLNAIPDECQSDCNQNQVADVCEADSDDDGVIDACDGCPSDSQKTEPAVCGCGVPDDDSDGDGTADCIDNCPNHPNVGQADCDGDGKGDACAIAEGLSRDCNADAVPDECVPPVAAPVPIAAPVPKNRFTSFAHDSGGVPAAIRVTFADLPGEYAVHNGTTMWLALPQEVSEHSSTVDPDSAPEYTTFWAATLQCQPAHLDWSVCGSVHVYHELIVPDGTYVLEAIAEGCDPASEFSYSAPLELTTSLRGDLVKDCTTCPCGAPDGRVDLQDVLAVLDKFANVPCAVSKTRADLARATPDLRIDVNDVLFVLRAFSRGPYPFPVPSPPCG